MKNDVGNIDKIPFDFRYVDFQDEYNKQFIEEDHVINDEIQNLDIGDFVKLKRLNYTVEIKHLNYDSKVMGIFDFAGVKIDDESGDLRLFNKKDVEEKVYLGKRK